MKKNANKFITIFLVLILLAGLSLLLYPTVSDYWNSFHQTRAIASYAEEVAQMDDNTYERILADAHAYNKALIANSARYHPTDEERAEYRNLLNIAGTGMMGYIEIPAIECSLPLYHGTDEAVLQIAIGHIEGTSLPVGGESTHCVVCGHRGLPSAKLFTNLDRLAVSDIFTIRILDEVLTYEVDQILIVDPPDIKDLKIEPGKDYFTLVTCTPYGINTHRLLVRGHRIDNLADYSSVHVTADLIQIDPLLVAPAVAVPILLFFLIALVVPRKSSKKRR